MQNKKARFAGSIRTRMVAIYLLVTLIALLAISFTVAMLVESFLVGLRTKSQLEDAKRIALDIAPEMELNNAEAAYKLISERAQELGGRILVLDTNAVTLLDSASYQTGWRFPYREVRDVLLGYKDISYGFHKITRSNTEAQNWLGIESSETVWAVYYVAPITVNGVYVGVVLYSSVIQDVENNVTNIITQIAAVFAAVAIVMSCIAFFLSGVVTKPIIKLTKAIRLMGREPGVKVEVSGTAEMREMGEAFNRMSEQIADHDRSRDEFVSNASHELKTPLATMKLLSETILYQDDPDPALMKEFFGDVNHEVDRLSNIISDLLRLVRFDQNEDMLITELMDLKPVAQTAIDRLRPIAETKGIAIEVELESAFVNGEKNRLDQVVTNLVENAVKYTDNGSVNVRLYKTDEEVIFSVEDTGIGIPEEAKAHVFERFYRVDKARSRATGGTGLGLAITERIVTLHNGYIEVDSQLNVGTKFTVHLPIPERGKDNE